MVSKVDLRTNDTRKRVLEEARRMYLKGGYNYLSMDKISEILGLKRPTLYYHFPGGKEELLVETIKAFTNELIAVWNKAIEAGTTTQGKLRNILDTIADYPLPENKRTILVELWELGEEVRTTVKQVHTQIFTVLSTVFEEGIKKGEIRPVPVELAMYSFLGLCDQVENLTISRQFFAELSSIANNFELDELIDRLFEIWLTGFAVGAA